MSSIARITEVTSSSRLNFQDAIERGVARATATLENVEGAFVKEQRVMIEEGEVCYRATLQVNFIVTD